MAWLLGFRVVEVPINWRDVRGAEVSLLKDWWRMFRNILPVRYMVPKSLGRMDLTKLSPARVRGSDDDTSRLGSISR